ncbi:aminotransferase class V-fold PLP-dependent enzyme [Chitinophaga rhizosphaerae]|uniref:aminotransferase class V-fold PLP-dependent enzyme n=1 Tax=Chitinophaga rhizosphaerae TaxID=1864947 RepID=UPI000F7FE99F|nr:cysteine desulfurase [Chitinophaga rhizosphaerae]
METATAQDIIWPEVELIRNEFPILQQTVNGRPLVYLDNGATTQKPVSVIRSMQEYYTQYNSNVHRGVHTLSQQATTAYEAARHAVAAFIGAHHHEVVFTKGTTDAINLVAAGFRKTILKEGDEIIISAMEHHSNIVPWQLACEEKGAKLKVVPISDKGELDMDAFRSMLNPRVKLVSITWISNTLGTVNPVHDIIALAHEQGIPVMLDAAQAAAHTPIKVHELDVDFLALSGHKLFGPTGIGILFGKESWLEQLPPYQGGGDMIKHVTFEKTTYADVPLKFEAGTPAICEAIGLGAAVAWVNRIGIHKIQAYEHQLTEYAVAALKQIEGLRFIGEARHRSGAISFLVGDTHPSDVGVLLDQQGIAVRTGHHCTQPLCDRFGIPGTVRASLAVYNTTADIDRLVEGVRKAVTLLG